MPRNLFQEALASAKARGCSPDKWVVNSHVVTALVENRRNSSVNYIDVVNIKEQTMEILGLPVRMSTKIDPMVVDAGRRQTRPFQLHHSPCARSDRTRPHRVKSSELARRNFKETIMSDEAKTILDIDTTKVALAVGHVAALALVAQLRDGDPDELSLYYRMFEPLEEGREGEEDLSMLAQYVCDRPTDVYGEQLYRKAAELALHNAPANGYDDQPFVVREAYRLFAKSARLVAVDLTVSKRQVRERLAKEEHKRKPIAPEDQTYAPDEPADAQDPVMLIASRSSLVARNNSPCSRKRTIILTLMMVCNIWYWAIEGVLRSLVRTDARGKPLPERQKPEPNAPLIRTPMPDFHLPATLYDLACVTGEKPMMVWQCLKAQRAVSQTLAYVDDSGKP